MKRFFVVIAAFLTLAGCGISPGQVIADGKAPNETLDRVTGTAVPLKRSELKITQQAELVLDFLRASAAYPGDPKTREDLMRTFVAGGDWKADTELKVVNIATPIAAPVYKDDGSYTVTIDVQHIGVLDDAGRLIPSTEGRKTYHYDVITVGGEYMLRNPPRDLLLPEVGGLDTYFQARPLYFYSGSGVLVPDVRYVSQGLSEEQKANTLLDWLYDGPSPWLASSVKKAPSETRPSVTKAVLGDDGSMAIDLSASLDAVELGQLKEQLARTLVRSPLTSLTIKVQGQEKVSKYQPASQQKRLPAARYVVVDGVVHRLKAPAVYSGDLPIPTELNKNVVAAAFSAGESSVALVQQNGTTQRLLVGGRTLAPVGLPSAATHIGQPVWLDHQGQTLLVQADDHIYQIGVDGSLVQDTEVPGLQAMSAYFDGRRLALVIDGTLYLASRNENGVIAIGAKLRLATEFDTVQGVAFGGVNQLVVSGSTASGVQLIRMNLDGTRSNPLGGTSQGTVSHVVADDLGTALYEVEGRGAYVGQLTSFQSLFDYIDWRPGQAPAAENKVHISAPSFEG